MKTKHLFLYVLFVCCSAATAFGQNRWGVMAGGNLSTSVSHRSIWVSTHSKYSLHRHSLYHEGHGLTLSAGAGYKF